MPPPDVRRAAAAERGAFWMLQAAICAAGAACVLTLRGPLGRALAAEDETSALGTAAAP